MSASQLNTQELLEQILASGKDLVEKGKSQSAGLTKKAKEIADKGEDVLVDKLDLEDNEATRDALRKGVGAGAAAGALALLLSSRSGRKLATLGGLAGLGTLAYKAYQKNGGKMPENWKDEIAGLLGGPKGEARSESLLRAMVAAAKADGDIHTDEMKVIKAHNAGSADVLAEILDQDPDPIAIARLADTGQAEREIYAVSCRIANGLNPKERDYLDNLAMALRLDPELAARIETDVRTG